MELGLFLIVFFCSLLSGVLAIGGGQALIFFLSILFPIPEAMFLHGTTQLTGNISRAAFFKKYLDFKSIKFYFLGSLLAATFFWKISYVPEKYIIYLFLGSLPLLGLVKNVASYFSILRPKNAVLAGFSLSLSQLLFGVSGSLVDVFYTQSGLNRFEIIANKSFTQCLGHIFKVFFYANVLAQSSFSGIKWHWVPLMMLTAFLGTYLGKKIVPYIKETHFVYLTRGLIFSFSFLLLFKGIRLYAENL